MRIPRNEATWRELRLARHLEARGEPGQVQALLGLKGTVVGRRHRIESLYAVGGESAVYLTRDLEDARAVRVAKVPLYPVHRSFDMESKTMRKQRQNLRIEGGFLRNSGSRTLPNFAGFFEFGNPLLDPARGGAFRESEPLLLMDKLPGSDLDRWLARMHSVQMPRAIMRRTLDRVVVIVLQSLVDLYDRDLIYADLRPANLRMMGRPERKVRLLDAGSLVRIGDESGRFPHVPSYLPPKLFWELVEGKKIVPSGESQSIMAGRTLYEVATGRIPHAGQELDYARLKDSNVSPQVAEVVEGLCRGDFTHVRHAYRYLAKRAAKRVHGANAPERITQQAPARSSPRVAAPAVSRRKPRRAMSRFRALIAAFFAFIFGS